MLDVLLQGHGALVHRRQHATGGVDDRLVRDAVVVAFVSVDPRLALDILR